MRHGYFVLRPHVAPARTTAVMQRSILQPMLLLLGVMRLLAPSEVFPAEHPSEAAQTMRLRLEWGGRAAQLWSGVIEISAGHFERPCSLGIEADEAGTLWIDGPAVWIQRRSARVYDGCDVTVMGPASATLSIHLQSVDEESVRGHLTAKLADFTLKTKVVRLGDGAGRLSVRRTPGDEMPLRFDRLHLVFAPGERFVPRVVVNRRAGRRAQAPFTINWHLTPARGKTVLDRGQRIVSLEETAAELLEVPLEIRLPKKEGAYDLRIVKTGGKSQQLNATVQVVMVSREPQRRPMKDDSMGNGTVPINRVDSGKATSGPEKPIDSFNPADSGLFRRVDLRSPLKLIGNSIRRLFNFIPNFANGDVPSPSGPKISWEAYRLRLEHPGQLHRLVVSFPNSRASGVGISLLEPNAAQQLMPIGLDSGVYFDVSRPRPAGADPVNASSGKSPFFRHEVLFWPRTVEPILMLHDFGSGQPPAVTSVEVYETETLSWALPSTRSSIELPVSRHRWFVSQTVPAGFAEIRRKSKPKFLRRLVGPYMHKPLLPENFGASEAFDSPSRRSLDDWETFHTAGLRVSEYLIRNGFNSLMLAVLADGSTIYPSLLLQPNPRYDTGIFFSTGQDPVRKDVLELLFRIFDREGLVLLPELQFSTPLPELERQLTIEGPRARGIELIGRDGRSWREARGAIRGLAPYYNPLDPRVQHAIVEVLRELVGRYQSHDAFCGVALELSSIGFLQFPGLQWGYDDDTISRFQQQTNIRVPTASGPEGFARRYDFLTGTARRSWIRWRCEQLAHFHRRLAETVTAAAPHARLVLSGNHILYATNADEKLLATLPTGGRLKHLLEFQGLDFQLYADEERITILRPTLLSMPESSTTRSIDETVTASRQLDSELSARQSGSLFYHLPQECRIPEFDAVSPWQPAYTWLVAQASPGGLANRARFARALASDDAFMIFDGGWMIPLGQEAHTRQVRDVIQRIPAIPFHLSAVQRQPLVVHLARRSDRTFLYAVNDFSAENEVTLHLSCPWKTAGRFLGRRGELQLQPRAGNGSRLTFRMEPYDIWAFELNDADVRVREIDIRLPRPALTSMQQRIRELDRAIANIQTTANSGKSLVSNPGFEETPPRLGVLPGWDVTATDGSFWNLDGANPHSGNSSLMLTSGRKNFAVLESRVPVGSNRLMVMSLWLRGDRSGTDVRLAFEAVVGGKQQVHFANVRVDSRWQRCLFRVKDIPADQIKNAKVRIEMRRPGKIWVDDVQVEMHHLTANDLRQLTKLFSAITLAWDDKRYADCERMLDSYWGQFLFAPASENPPGNSESRSAGRLSRFFHR